MRLAIALPLVLALGACTTRLEPLTEPELLARASGDRNVLRAARVPVERPLGFGETVAHALANNLDIRLASLESVIARGAVDLADAAKLPQLVLNAGYSWRDPVRVSVDDARPGDELTRTRNAELSWNILDFGVSYVRAKQAANDALASEERRRRVANGIINEVRFAYWTALLGAQRVPQLKALEAELVESHRRSRQLAEIGLQDPMVALNYQDGLLELQRQLKSYQTELAQANLRLTRMLNLAPAQPLALRAVPPGDEHRGLRELERAALEDVALATRSELREAEYAKRNRRYDVINAYLGALPSLRLRLARQFDSTSTLEQHYWQDRGYAFTWNLTNIYSALGRAEFAGQGVAVAEIRRLALSMSVMEQVALSHEQLYILDDDYRLSREMSAVRRKIYEVRRERLPFTDTDELERSRAAVAAFAAQIREDRAYAALQKAYGDLLAAMGLDQFPADLEFADPQAPLAIERHIAGLPGTVRELAGKIAAAAPSTER